MTWLQLLVLLLFIVAALTAATWWITRALRELFDRTRLLVTAELAAMIRDFYRAQMPARGAAERSDES